MEAVVARMDAVVARVRKLAFRRDDGQDLIEYALLIALISIVAMVAIGAVGTTVKTVFWDTFTSAIASAV
jgi:Flp pilus assembly pilin Flp